MKKSKKIFSIVLSLILIIGITTTVFIATANTKETAVEITVDKAELSVGQFATVSVKVTANYPIATMSIPFFYDKTLVDVSDATATLTDYSVKNAITESESADTSKVYAVIFAWVPQNVNVPDWKNTDWSDSIGEDWNENGGCRCG